MNNYLLILLACVFIISCNSKNEKAKDEKCFAQKDSTQNHFNVDSVLALVRVAYGDTKFGMSMEEEQETKAINETVRKF